MLDNHCWREEQRNERGRRDGASHWEFRLGRKESSSGNFVFCVPVARGSWINIMAFLALVESVVRADCLLILMLEAARPARGTFEAESRDND